MARASSANAASPQTALTTWCPASSTAPSPVATHTVSRMASRSDRVRTNSGVPARAFAQMPPAAGRSCAPEPRAPRTTTTVSATAMPSCVSAVPSPEPAIPMPTP